MKRVLLMTVLLAGLAVALVAVMVFYNPKRTPEESWQPESFSQPREMFREIKLVFPDRTIELRNIANTKFYRVVLDGRERITDPVMSDRVVSAVRGLAKTKLIDLDPADLTIYGLQDPALNIEAVHEDGRPLKLMIGKMNYNKDGLFAKLADQPTVFLVPVDLLSIFQVQPRDLLSRALMIIDPADILSIKVRILNEELRARLPEAFDPKVVVQKQPDGPPQWFITEPVSEKADFPAVRDLFNHLVITNAQQVIDIQPGELAKYKLDKPQAEVVVTLNNGKEQRIVFGGIFDKYVVAMNLSSDQGMMIMQGRMHEILRFNPRIPSPVADIREMVPTEIRLDFPRSGKPPLLIKHQHDEFFALEGDPDAKVMLGRVTILTASVRGAGSVIRHREPYNRAEFGLDRPQLHMVVVEGDTVPIDVSFGNTVYLNSVLNTVVEDNKRKCIYAFSGDLMRDMPLTSEELKAEWKK